MADQENGTFEDNGPGWKVVDLGTKRGNALEAFLGKGAMYYGPEINHICRSECLGIDKATKYRGDVEGRGFAFRCLDVVSGGFTWPDAEYYLAWDFLEHLPSVEDSMSVLATMIDHATKGVWLKMPSFEQDETGEGQLRKHGLRFTWTNWHGHPSAFRLEHVKKVLDIKCPKATCKHKQQRIIRDSGSEFVVPIDAPIDVTEYAADCGPKPYVVFRPPVIGCHELIVYLR